MKKKDNIENVFSQLKGVEIKPKKKVWRRIAFILLFGGLSSKVRMILALTTLSILGVGGSIFFGSNNSSLESASQPENIQKSENNTIIEKVKIPSFSESRSTLTSSSKSKSTSTSSSIARLSTMSNDNKPEKTIIEKVQNEEIENQYTNSKRVRIDRNSKKENTSTKKLDPQINEDQKSSSQSDHASPRICSDRSLKGDNSIVDQEKSNEMQLTTFSTSFLQLHSKHPSQILSSKLALIPEEFYTKSKLQLKPFIQLDGLLLNNVIGTLDQNLNVPLNTDIQLGLKYLNIEVATGIGYDRLQFNESDQTLSISTTDTTFTMKTDSVFIQDSLSNNIFSHIDTSFIANPTTTTSTSTIKGTRNAMSYITIPLNIGYNYTYRRHTFIANTGVRIHILKSHTRTQPENATINPNKTFTTINGKLGYRYNVSRNFSAGIYGQYSQTINSPFDSKAKFKLVSGGLTTRWSF